MIEFCVERILSIKKNLINCMNLALVLETEVVKLLDN